MPEAPQFDTVRNGYDPAAVDAWARGQMREVDDLRDQLHAATYQVAELEQLQRQSDERVGAGMTRAQAAADLTLHEATREAERLREEAREEARNIHAEELEVATRRLQELIDRADQAEQYMEQLQEVTNNRVQAARDALQQAIDMLKVDGRTPVEHKATLDYPTPNRPSTLSDLVGDVEPDPRDEVMDVLGGAGASA